MTETSGEMEVPSELETDERADKVTDVDQQSDPQTSRQISSFVRQ